MGYFKIHITVVSNIILIIFETKNLVIILQVKNIIYGQHIFKINILTYYIILRMI